MKSGFSKSITGATIILSVIGIASKGFGFLREIIFASYFGLSTNYELYLIAAVLPITINTIILFLTQNIYIPAYLKIKQSDPIKAKMFFLQNMILFFFAGLILLGIFFFVSDAFISFYVKSQNIVVLNKTKGIFSIFLITIPLNAIVSVISAHLFAEKRFILPTISQLLLNVSIIILVFIFTKEYGIFTIPYGYLIGSFLQLSILLIYIRTELKNPKLSIMSMGNLKIILGPMVITIFIEAISQVHLLADRYFINQVEAGGIAALNYAMTLFILPISIITISLSTAIFPSFTESIINANSEELTSRIKKSLQFIFFFFIPISLVYIYSGDQIIKLIFQRGNFSQADTLLTSDVLSIYAISLTFYSIYSLLYKLLYSASLLKHLLIIISIAAVIKVLLNFFLVNYYYQNGLALSSTITYTFLFLTSAYLLDQKIKTKILSISFKNFTLYTLNVLLSYLIAHLLIAIFMLGAINIIVEVLIIFSIFVINILIIDKLFFNEFFISLKIHSGR